MPHLPSARDIPDCLRDRISGQRHWVFVAEGDPGFHLLLASLTAFLLRGCPQRELDWGSFVFKDAPRATNLDLHFLTVPKKYLDRADLPRLFADVTSDAGGVGDPGGRNTILVSAGSPPQLMADAIDLIVSDQVRTTPPPHQDN